MAAAILTSTLEAKSYYSLCHWNNGSKSYTLVKTDASGYDLHITSGSHTNDKTDLSFCGGSIG